MDKNPVQKSKCFSVKTSLTFNKRKRMANKQWYFFLATNLYCFVNTILFLLQYSNLLVFILQLICFLFFNGL